MIAIGIILIVLLVVLILAVLALIGLISTAVSQLRIMTGAASMLATTFDERCVDDSSERIFFRHLARAIYNGIVDGGFHLRQN